MTKISHKKINTVWFRLSELPRADRFIQTGSRMVVKIGWEREGGATASWVQSVGFTG